MHFYQEIKTAYLSNCEVLSCGDNLATSFYHRGKLYASDKLLMSFMFNAQSSLRCQVPYPKVYAKQKTDSSESDMGFRKSAILGRGGATERAEGDL